MSKQSTINERPIINIDSYNHSMSKSLIDKIFFMDKVEADVFIDFGCADGTIIYTLNKLFPHHTYIGYDCNPDMIAIANQGVNSDNEGGLFFTTELSEVRSKIDKYVEDGKKICVILNSMIHEVYSYSSRNLDEFWATIFGLEPDYIAIRDMCVSKTTSRPADPISVARIRQLYDSEMIAEWEANWGALDENWSLVHFLLTYRYTDNWEREIKENYLPIPKEDLLALIPREYFPDFVEHFTLPYIRNKVFEDFGIQLQDRTHLKLILRKIENDNG